MLGSRYNNKFCIDGIQSIPNYNKAVSDPDNWYVCHHVLETRNSDGEFRPVSLTPAELKALDMYYNRPANELIFLTRAEHNDEHFSNRVGKNKGKTTKKKGTHLSQETKDKISNSLKGRKHSEEEIRKIKESCKGGNSTSWSKGHTPWNKGKKLK